MMAFYFALFNVSNANLELRQAEKDYHIHGKKECLGGRRKLTKLRRHSVASTQDVGDYRLLPKPTVVHSNTQNSKPLEASTKNVTEVAAAMTALDVVSGEIDSDGGRSLKKVTFDASDAIGTLRVAVSGQNRQKLSENSFLEGPVQLTQSAYDDRTESLSRKTAWIYSIPLSPSRGNIANGGRNLLSPKSTRIPSPQTGALSPGTTASRRPKTASSSSGLCTVQRILCDRCREVEDRCGGVCGTCSSGEALNAAGAATANKTRISPRTFLELVNPSNLIRRRSMLDRSASLTTAVRRNAGIRRRVSSSGQRFRCSLMDAGERIIPLFADVHDDNNVTNCFKSSVS